MTKTRKQRLKNKLKKIMKIHGFFRVDAINFHNKNKGKSLIIRFTKKGTVLKEKIARVYTAISNIVKEIKYSIEEIIERKRLKIRKKIQNRLKYATLVFK